jgi:hypothetical protein
MASTSALTRDAQPQEPVVARPRTVSLAFRQVDLSPVGWTALLAPGAAVGLAAGLSRSRGGLRIGWLAAATVAGAVAGVALARLADELRWRRSALCIELDEPDAVLDLLQAVRAEGVHADMIRSGDGPAGTTAGYALRYRARDDRRVRAVLSAQQG